MISHVPVINNGKKGQMYKIFSLPPLRFVKNPEYTNKILYFTQNPCHHNCNIILYNIIRIKKYHSNFNQQMRLIKSIAV